MQKEDKQILTFNAGLHTDSHKSSQPEGTYSWALTAILESHKGSDGGLADYLCSEPGNTNIQTLTNGYNLIGYIPLLEDDVVLFLVNPSTDLSRIVLGTRGLQTLTDLVTETASNTFLNFQLDKQIQGIFRVRGCDRHIYWTDDFNIIRSINIDELLRSPSTYQDTSGNWDETEFRLFPAYQQAIISSMQVLNGGGELDVGCYQATVRYLDSDGNPTQYFVTSPAVPIIDESYSAGNIIELLDGAETGTATTKAIKVSLTNLDLDYKYYQVAILETNAGTGNVNRVILNEPVPITQTTSDYIYRGANISDDQIISLSEVISPVKSYHTCKTITQVDNRLVIANTKERDIDHAVLQQHSCKIGVTYFTQLEDARDRNVNPRSATYYFDTRGYTRDEIYALGVVYVFNDGYETPPYHLIGRAKDTHSDGSPVLNFTEVTPHSRIAATTSWDSENVYYSQDIDHLDGTAERWETYNTAKRTKGTSTGVVTDDSNWLTQGELAYYQHESDVYPTIEDCDGAPIFVDVNGNDLSGEPVRWFKMPDATLEPIYHGPDRDFPFVDISDPPSLPSVGTDSPDGLQYISCLGIQLSNITIPTVYQNDIIGVKIVRTSRKDGCYSVLSKGMLIPYEFRGATVNGVATLDMNPEDATSFGTQVIPSNVDVSFEQVDKYCTFYGAEGLINEDILSPSYVKFENEIWGHANIIVGSGTFVFYNFYSRTIPKTALTNRTVLESGYVPANTQFGGQGFTLGIDNNASHQKLLLKLNFTSTPNPGLEYNLNTLAGFDPAASDGAYYAALKRSSPNIPNLENIVYRDTVGNMKTITPTAASSVTLFGGGTFVSRIDVKRWHGSASPDGASSATFWLESEINTELRHEGEGVCGAYFPKSYTVGGVTYTAAATTWLDTDPEPCDYYIQYHYNPDYSKDNNDKSYFPLSRTFDYCDDCLGRQQHRIAWSERSFSEEITDYYKSFLANNYKEIQGNTGPITNIFTKNNNLYISTTQALWMQNLSSGEIQTANIDNIIVSTGAAFSQKERQAVDTPLGYAGSQSQWATIQTEHGVLFIDQKRGKVHLLSSQLSNITGPESGVEKWFNEHLPSILLEQLPTFPFSDNPANPDGIGITAVYDTSFDRYILHKKDYRVVGLSSQNGGVYDSSLTYSSGDVSFDLENEIWKVKNAGAGFTTITLRSNPQYFENRSFTVSFSLKKKRWISYHPYFPSLFINLRTSFFSTINLGSSDSASAIYEHNTGLSQTFYGNRYPHIIEFSLAKGTVETWVTDTLSYISTVQTYNSTKREWYEVPNVTFSHLTVYNDTQLSGLLSLLVKDTQATAFQNIYPSATTALVDRTERTWNISEFSDYVDHSVQEPLFTSEWSSSTIYSFNPWMDKVINSNVIDTGKSDFEVERFRDKFVTMRLQTNSFEENNTTTDYRFTTRIGVISRRLSKK